MVIGDFKGLFEKDYCLVKLLRILVGKTFAVVKFSIVGHQLDGTVEVLMGQVDLLQCQIGVSSVEKGTGIIGV